MTISLEIIMYIVTILAEELICTCPKSNLALQKELFNVPAQHFFNLVPRSMQKAGSLSSFKVLINTYHF